MSNNPKLKLFIKLIGNIILIFVIIFMIKIIIDYDIDYSPYLHIKFILLLLLFLACSTILSFINALVWHVLLQFSCRKKFRKKDTLKIYLKSNLGKYIPGNVMQFAQRGLLAKDLGSSQVCIGISTILELVMVWLTCVVWSLLLAKNQFLSLVDEYIPHNFSNSIIILGIIIVIIVISLIYIFREKIAKLLVDFKNIFRIDLLPVTLKSFLSISFILLLHGIFLMIIISFNTPVEINDLLLIEIAYIVSWLIGYMAPGSPAGIGVRETILTVMLGARFGSGIVLSAGIIQRIILILSDIISYGITNTKKWNAI